MHYFLVSEMSQKEDVSDRPLIQVLLDITHTR